MTTSAPRPDTAPWARLVITLRQHAALGTGARSDFRHDTHSHIPGSVLRGACAAAWIRDHTTTPATDATFLDIFEGDGTFGPAHTDTSIPTPLSILRHKHEPGPDCVRHWWDQALGDTATRCPDCGQHLEPSRGEPLGPTPITSRTRVELDTDGVAVPEKLFQRSALSRGTVLTAWLSGAATRALERSDAPVTRLTLGGERSIRGGADVTLHQSDTPEPVELHDGNVVLRLSAPGVFVDDYGLPCDHPDEQELTDCLGTTATIVQAWTRWTAVGGWHAASGLPKPVERAVAPGATYLVRCAEPPTEHARRAMRVRGIGLRRREGYGALAIAPDRRHTTTWWHRQTVILTTFTDWPKLLRLLQTRAATWPADPTNDTRLSTALRKPMTSSQHTALELLLSVTDRTHYTTLLTRLERS